MKPFHSLLFVLALCFGCVNRHRASIPENPYPDFDSAIEAIATTEDIYVAGAAAKQLYAGGVPAINALREHLSDERVIPSGFCTRSLNRSDLTMAEQMRWSIQDMIETGLPKIYDQSYYVLRNGNLEQWLDQRKGMSFVELQIEAATTQLNHAKAQMAKGDPNAKDAIEMIEDRLLDLRRAAQE